jgi:hypothetical protein
MMLSKQLFAKMGKPAWDEFWVWFATYIRDLELKYKGQPNAGKIKADELKTAAHAKLAPYLPDWTEVAIFAYLDTILDQVVPKLNKEISQDWVTAVEDVEHLVAVYIEPFLGIDLDEDGNIGAGTAGKVGAIILGLLLLSQPGPCEARGRRLVEHNVFSEEGVATPAPVAPGELPPRSDTVKPSSIPSTLPTISTWAGYRTNGKGTDTWDGGLAATLRKAGSTWGLTALAGKNGVGVGPSWKRLGGMVFFDGTLTAGAFISAIEF